MFKKEAGEVRGKSGKHGSIAFGAVSHVFQYGQRKIFFLVKAYIMPGSGCAFLSGCFVHEPVATVTAVEERAGKHYLLVFGAGSLSQHGAGLSALQGEVIAVGMSGLIKYFHAGVQE